MQYSNACFATLYAIDDQRNAFIHSTSASTIALCWPFILFFFRIRDFLNGRTKSIQLKSFQIPILVVGTKAELVDDAQRIKQLSRGGNIGERCYLAAA